MWKIWEQNLRRFFSNKHDENKICSECREPLTTFLECSRGICSHCNICKWTNEKRQAVTGLTKAAVNADAHKVSESIMTLKGSH